MLIVARVVARYKAAMTAQRLTSAWTNFKEWEFLKTLAEDLGTLAKAFDSAPLKKKADFVASLDRTLKELDREFTPRFRELSKYPSSLTKLRADLKPKLRVWLSIDDRIFGDEAVAEDVEKSPVSKALRDYDRGELDRFGVEEFTDEDLQWARALDFDKQKSAYQRVLREVPDLRPAPGEEGTFEYFEEWIRHLPEGLGGWEDVLPYYFEDVVADSLAETDIWKRLEKVLGGSGPSYFSHLQDEAWRLKEGMDEGIEPNE